MTRGYNFRSHRNWTGWRTNRIKRERTGRVVHGSMDADQSGFIPAFVHEKGIRNHQRRRRPHCGRRGLEVIQVHQQRGNTTGPIHLPYQCLMITFEWNLWVYCGNDRRVRTTRSRKNRADLLTTFDDLTTTTDTSSTPQHKWATSSPISYATPNNDGCGSDPFVCNGFNTATINVKQPNNTNERTTRTTEQHGCCKKGPQHQSHINEQHEQQNNMNNWTTEQHEQHE